MPGFYRSGSVVKPILTSVMTLNNTTNTTNTTYEEKRRKKEVELREIEGKEEEVRRV